MTDIKQNIADVGHRICLEAEKNNRNPADITLLAVSKTRPAEQIRIAWQAGQSCFGENYLQEALEKIEELQDLAIEWHFIGPIQSNKTRSISESFQWVHTVDRLKIAQRLNNQRPLNLPALNICIQVNISGEDNKSGIRPCDLVQFAQEITALDHLNLRGLMAIPEATDDQQLQRLRFAQLHALYLQVKAIDPTIDTLSMGMSADMAQAISEGSTMVRIGTDIFGKRD
ncbi:MAG: pyridoxal phosphate enzyme (YggS family) [Pseudomonadales bacterium]|jgi:pyridoxal phosphate enzyme (YggS family)